jgi:glycerophosphoryl diester phosphodiesterase
VSHWLEASRLLVIGHRGASAHAPENSLTSFALAAELGADAIELDIRLTADGWPIVMHDATVDRTTGGHGAVAGLTLAQVRELATADGRPVPTLDEVFEAFGPALLYNLELKGQGLFGRDLATAVADRIEGHQLASRVLVSSFNPLLLRRGRRHFARSTPLALIKGHRRAGPADLLFSGPAENPDYRLVDEKYMARARRRGQRVFAWTVDQAAEARRLARLGVHGLITNHPAAIISGLESE